MSNVVSVHIRFIQKRDVPEVLEIENHLKEFAWLERDFIRCLRSKNCIGFAAELNGQVVGYMIYKLRKYKLVLLKMVVHPFLRRKSIGTQMINKLKSKLFYKRRNMIDLKCEDSNLDGHLFLRKQGFRASKVIRGRFGVDDFYYFAFKDNPVCDPCNRISQLIGEHNENID